MLPLHLALLLSVICPDVFANPTPAVPPATGVSMNLMRRSLSPSRTQEEIGLWAKKHRESLISKYSGGQISRRGTGTNLMVNQNYDSSFYGSLAIGTPAISYNVILDTGSSDLWVASSECTAGSGCDGVETFDPSKSSTFTDKNTAFSIQYGTGGASGTLGSDTVQMAGFSVSNQVFGVCDIVDSVLDAPVSGLLGLGFSSISRSGATPLWQTLVESGAWDSPVMAFQLTRYNNDTQAESLEQGGTFTMGFVNSSLYTGDIEYNDIPANQVGFWTQTLTSLTVQGNAITLGIDNDILAAIDTGTTAVGGPSQYIAEIYTQIPGSAAGTGNLEGYYTYPCSTAVNVTMSFGGRSWSISSDDFELNQLNKELCLGAFFDLTTGSSVSWIVGDTFLKNVYSVFRYNPASVGFAELSDYALSLNGDDKAAIPSATIGSVVAEVSATGTSRRSDATNHTPSVYIIFLSLLVIILT